MRAFGEDVMCVRAAFMKRLFDERSTCRFFGSVLFGTMLLQVPVNAQTSPQPETGASSPRTDLICVTRTVPEMPGSSVDTPRSRSEVRIRVPASKLKKLKEAGFQASSCASSGDSVPVAGLTLCQMAARGDPAFNAAFFRAHKVSLEQVCRHADPQ